MYTDRSKMGDLWKVVYGGGMFERGQVTCEVPQPVPWTRLSVSPSQAVIVLLLLSSKQ